MLRGLKGHLIFRGIKMPEISVHSPFGRLRILDLSKWWFLKQSLGLLFRFKKVTAEFAENAEGFISQLLTNTDKYYKFYGMTVISNFKYLGACPEDLYF